jgi:hypothetical protein
MHRVGAEDCGPKRGDKSVPRGETEIVASLPNYTPRLTRPVPAARMRGMEDKPLAHEDWRMRPWAIVLLILTAIAFGAQVVMVGLAFLTVSTGVLLASWVALLIMNLRSRPPA